MADAQCIVWRYLLARHCREFAGEALEIAGRVSRRNVASNVFGTDLGAGWKGETMLPCDDRLYIDVVQRGVLQFEEELSPRRRRAYGASQHLRQL